MPSAPRGGIRIVLGVIGLAGVLLAGAAYAQLGLGTRTAFFGDQPSRDHGEDGKRAPSSDRDGAVPPALPQAEAPITNPKQGAFRLGRQVGLAALGRARGKAATADRIFAKAQQNAKDLGVTLRPLPTLSGDEIKDSAAALHYLLDTVGKPVATTLSAKYGADHATAFERGFELSVWSLFNDAAIVAGDAIDRELASAPQVAPAKPKRQPRLDERLD
jgi:hypothetical protein